MATVRRDLSVLEREGVASRTHGGALSTRARGADQAFAWREQVDPDAKRAIARRAVALVGPGQTLLLNDGSTVLAVARELVAAHLALTVATPGVNVATCLSESKSITTYLLGGLVRHRSVGTSGPFAEQMLSSINADLALIASDSFSVREGLAFAYETDARLARLMHEQAATTVILATARKLGQRDRFTAFRAEEAHMLFTDCDRLAMTEPFARIWGRGGVMSTCRGGGGPGRAGPSPPGVPWLWIGTCRSVLMAACARQADPCLARLRSWIRRDPNPAARGPAHGALHRRRFWHARLGARPNPKLFMG